MESKMGYTKRNCDFCKREYFADNRNLKRGWGLCCSKSCAAKKRERGRPDYDPGVVRLNNLKRAGLLRDVCHDREAYEDQWGDMDIGIS